MALSITEFASKIKAKYPDYSDMDDTVLVNKIVDKYPEYKSTVDLGSSAPAPKPELPQFAQQAQEPQPQANAGYSGPVLPQNNAPSFFRGGKPSSNGASESFGGQPETNVGQDLLSVGKGLVKSVVDPVVLAGKALVGGITHPVQSVENYPQFLVGSAKGVGQAGVGLANMVTTPGRAISNLPNIASDISSGVPLNRVYQNFKSDMAQSEIPTPNVLQPLNPQQEAGVPYGLAAVNLATMMEMPGAKGVSLKTPAGITESALDDAIQQGVNKGIKPTVIGKPSINKLDKFYDNANVAVKTIADNKDNLNLVDKNGEAVSKPQNMEQFARAIDQTKQSIYNQYNAMSKAAGDNSAQFNASNIVSKLQGISTDLKYEPAQREYANKMIDQVSELQGQAPEVIEARIAKLNKGLQPFYASRSASLDAEIDAGVASAMREELDNNITNAVGPGYQDLKNKYGALKSIENEVAKRALVMARKAPKGMFDLADIYAGGEAALGVATANPALILKSIAIHGGKEVTKYLNNPDRFIKNMFNKAWDYEAPKPEAPFVLGQDNSRPLVEDQSPITDESRMLPAPMIDNGAPLSQIQQQMPTMRQRYEAAGTTPGATQPNNYLQLPAPGQAGQFQIPNFDVQNSGVQLGVSLATMRQRLEAIGRQREQSAPVQLSEVQKQAEKPIQARSTVGTGVVSDDPFYRNLLSANEYKKQNKEVKLSEVFNKKAQAENAPEAPPYSSPNELLSPEEYGKRFEDQQMNSAYQGGYSSEHVTPHATNPVTDKLKSAIKRDFFPGVTGEKDIRFEDLSPAKQVQINKRVGSMNTDPDALRPYAEAGLIKKGEEIHPDDIVQWANEAGKVELPKKKGVSLGNLFTNHRSGAIGGSGVKLSRDAVEPTETYYNPDMAKQAKSNGVSYVGSMKADPKHGVPVDYHYFQDGGMDDGTGSFPVKGSANLKDVLDQHRGNFAKKEKLLDNQRPGSIGSALGIKPKVDNLGFYSNAEKAVNEINMPKAPADQWAAMLDPAKGKGTKADEMKWIGLDDFLKEKGNQSVSKQEIQDFIERNKVQLEEVVKGEPKNLEEEALKVFNRPLESLSPYERRTLTTGNLEGRRYDGSSDNRKFQSYQLPGGSNYRELLMTLPVKRKDTFQQFLKYHKERFPSSGMSDDEIKDIYKNSSAVIPGAGKLTGAQEENTYHGAHWDEPNVLAHVRLNDRTDAEGKKVLFAEELQSDWHQEGRKKGYQQELTKDEKDVLDNLDKRASELKEKQQNLPPSSPEHAAIYKELNEINAKEFSIKKHDSVPAAPFSKTWHELAFKRILREAAEKGYDKVAWTTGEQQAARYDLSKHIGKAIWNEDTKMLTAYDPSMEKTVLQVDIKSPQELENYIGKDAAQKLIDAKPDTEMDRTISGLDLKVGGEGMKGFYDKILVDYANKYGKKWGAKAGSVKLKNGETVHSMDITPAMRKSVMEEGQSIGQVGNKNISGTAMLTGMAGASAVGLSIPKIYNMMTRNNQNNDKNKPVSLATITKR